MRKVGFFKAGDHSEFKNSQAKNNNADNRGGCFNDF
jgi:hypothetical protein